MSVEHLEVLVEEPSMEAALRVLLPKVLGPISFDIYPYQCKDELLARLPARLSGYSRWIKDSWRILVVVDRDDDDCVNLKRTLDDMARNAGLGTHTGSQGNRWTVLNRLAIEEMEAWYFGDWQAVCKAYPRVPATIPMQAKYRDPDAVAGGTWEAFERILQRAGYFKGGLPKIAAARTIAPHMVPTENTSKSFQVLNAALQEMTAA